MKIVLDTNILLRTLISQGNILDLFFDDRLIVYAPKKLEEEFIKNQEEINEIRDRVLGTEFFISGTARKNQMFNNIEIIAQDIEEVNPDLLIEKLEKVG